MNKKAFVIGVTGQDGAYRREHLLSKGYIVHGGRRRVLFFDFERVDRRPEWNTMFANASPRLRRLGQAAGTLKADRS